MSVVSFSKKNTGMLTWQSKFVTKQTSLHCSNLFLLNAFSSKWPVCFLCTQSPKQTLDCCVNYITNNSVCEKSRGAHGERCQRWKMCFLETGWQKKKTQQKKQINWLATEVKEVPMEFFAVPHMVPSLFSLSTSPWNYGNPDFTFTHILMGVCLFAYIMLPILVMNKQQNQSTKCRSF